MKLITSYIIFFLSLSVLNAQPKVYMGVIENEDTLLLGDLPEFTLNQKRKMPCNESNHTNRFQRILRSSNDSWCKMTLKIYILKIKSFYLWEFF